MSRHLQAKAFLMNGRQSGVAVVCGQGRGEQDAGERAEAVVVLPLGGDHRG